jgi:uncharacterized protein YprB with RNaseH-like and TPR domain
MDGGEGRAAIHQRLRRLGLSRGPQEIRKKRREPRRPIEDLLAGELIYTAHGPYFHYREVHGLDYRHGDHALAELQARSWQAPARLARDERLAEVDLHRIAFIDTETTGLAGGTGTYAFLVGVGVFQGDEFTIHQFFMRDYDEEHAQLRALGDLLEGIDAIVSFNGKSFDMPLLHTRFLMARQAPRLEDAPHLDLLPVARRFWKYRLDSCALSSLETHVLGVQRTLEDVPGWLIPELYTDYARTGDACEMPRIFYHNAQDILSLVTLTARLCEVVAAPLPWTAPLPWGGDVHGEDLYGLGRLLRDWGDRERAEAAFRQATETSRSPDIREMTMRDLAFLLKRQGRRGEALPWWQRLAEEHGAIYACEELAKHYEWQDEDIAQAIAWTTEGLRLAQSQRTGPRRQATLSDLDHRLNRLEGKASEDATPEIPGGC